MNAMTRYSNCIYNVHIADGFADDCEELIHRCSRKEPLTYQTFCTIWKDMNFASIYQGRSLGSEIAELSEEVIHIAKRYMVANTGNFEESVAGVFLVYALLNLQPFSGFAALRLIPEDVPAINRIEVVARRERRYDVLYILGTIMVKGPCQFHAEQRERGMELPLRKYLEGYTTIDRAGVRPKGVFYRQNEELDILRELSTFYRRYAESKAVVEKNEKDSSLKYADHTIANKLDASLKKIINGLIDEKDDSSTSDHQNVQAIKMKAMRNAVNPMRHLTGVNEKKSNSPSPKKASDIKSKPGKIKSCSPKLVTNGSPRKRIHSKGNSNAKGNVKTKRRKKKQATPPSSSSGDDISVGDDRDVELSLDYFSKKEELEREIENKKQPEFDETEEQEIDIEIDSLPVLIRKGNPDNYIEIEIIDHLKTNERDKEKQLNEEPVEEIPEKEKKKKLRNKLSTLKDVSIKKVKETGDSAKDSLESSVEEITEMAKLSRITADDALFKKPSKPYQAPKLKRLEKRDLKKPIIKSKFKRMGILPVANFKESK